MLQKDYKELRQKKEKTAARIINHAQERLIAFMPYFNRAILKMPPEIIESKPQFETDDLEETPTAENCGTDGTKIYFDADYALEKFRENPAKVPRIYMHMVFHCLFYHPFQYDKMEFEVWDFSCDMAVENTILEMRKKDLELPDDIRRRDFIERLRPNVETVTAENLYNYYMDNRHQWTEDMKYAPLFKEDDHALWVSVFHIVGKQRYSNRNDLDGRGNNVMEEWKEIGKTIQMNVEAVSKYREEKPGSVVENIREIYRERYNYSDFLKKFVSPNEEIKVNQDEFDYIYYTYGMKLYENMPLIEPLEYREEKKIRDFIIAIDTSGSCRGDVVKSFLNKTYTILKDSDCFFENMNVHIVQCDSKVQSVARITSQEEFDRYIKDMNVQGFGGTDFRPVFEYAEEQLQKKAFTDFRGILYLTDGLGVYPKAPPEYPAAFMILEDPKEKAQVPNWAMKLYVRQSDVLNGSNLMYAGK